MKRLLTVALVLLAVGCNFVQRPTTGTTTAGASPASQTSPDSWRKKSSGSFTAEVLSVECRPLKATDAVSGKTVDGPESVIVRVRISNSSDTVDTSGWRVGRDEATDNFGNKVEPALDGLLLNNAEPSTMGTLAPGSPAESSFAFKKPIQKATEINFTVRAILPNAKEKSESFKFTVPLPPAK